MAPATGMPADSEPALQFDNVTCRFGNYTAVQNVSLTVKEGEFLSVVGPTGCGKSTLLNIAAGVRTFARSCRDACGTSPAGVAPDLT
jgi:NitT/TauT family transport system ATP-binding protein